MSFQELIVDRNIATVLKEELLQNSNTQVIAADPSAYKVFFDTLFFQEIVVSENQLIDVRSFWKKTALRLIPGLKILTSDAMEFVIREKFFKDNLGYAKVVVKNLNHLLPLLLGVRSSEQLKSIYPKIVQKKEWRSIQKVWKFIREEKIISDKWLPGLLLQHLLDMGSDAPKVSDARLIFVLGHQLSFVERDLIEKLNHLFPGGVRLCKPEILVGRTHPYFCQSDQGFNTLPNFFETKVSKIKQSRVFKEVENTLLEVDGTVSQIRNWLEQGVAPQKIGVFLNDFSEYSFLLLQALDAEGVEHNLSVSHSIFSENLAQRWISKISINLGQSNYFDWEISKKNLDQNTYLDFYKKKFYFLSQSYIYSDKKEKRGTLEDFFLWALEMCDKDFLETASDAYHKISDQFNFTCEASFTSWLDFLKSCLKSMKKNIKSAKNGVRVESLLGIEFSCVTHVVVMGLCHKTLEKSLSADLICDDLKVDRIFQDLGIVLEGHGFNPLEGLLMSLLMSDREQVLFSYPKLSLSGHIQDPSLFFILGRHCFSKVKPNLPSSVWLSQSLRPFKSEDACLVKKSNLEISFSASLLKMYNQCPFLVAADKVFKLDNQEAWQECWSPLEKGRLLHTFLEKLGKEENLDVLDLKSFYEEHIELLRNEQGLTNLSLEREQIWKSVEKPKYLAILENFVKNEKNLQQTQYDQVTQRQTLCEIPFEMFWDEGGKKFTSNETPYKFKGRIDRLDYLKSDSEACVFVMDYKISNNSISSKNVLSWVKEKDFQLFIYFFACEGGFLKGLSKDLEGRFCSTKTTVQALLYYVVGNDVSLKGWMDSSKKTKASKKRFFLDKKELHLQLDELKLLLSDACKKIGEGDFSPSPKNESICKNCHWRTLCRANHLEI